MPPSDAQIERAHLKEQWVLHVEAGKDVKAVRDALGLPYKVSYFPHLRRRYHQQGERWEAFLDRRHGQATKGTPGVKNFLFETKRAEAHLTAPQLRQQVWEQFEIDISTSRINELLHAEGLSNPRGRPPGQTTPRAERETAEGQDLDNAGLFLS
jgi:transposase